VGEFVNGISWAETLSEKTKGSRAFYNTSGKRITDWFDNARNVSEGFAAVKKAGK